MFRARPIPSCDSEGVNSVALTRGEARRNDFASGLSCVSWVRTKVHMSTRTSVGRHRVWTTTQSTSFISVLLRPCDSFTPLSPNKTCYHVILPVKVLGTEVNMSGRSSVQNHWHFEHYLQSLCLPVLPAARNRTKIVPKSFPMSLFLGSTVWSSLLILRISWHAAAAALNSWPSRL